MKKIATGITLLIAGILAGILFQSNTGFYGGTGMRSETAVNDGPKSTDREASAKSGGEILYWVAPMEPAYRRDEPGKSPMGMDLVPVYAGDESEPGTVTISPAVVNNLGVRTDVVERGKLGRMIRTVGYVDYDETRISHVHTRTEGWIEVLKVRAEGERVSRGQHLFDLYSPAMINAQEEYIQALERGSQGLIRAGRQKLSALGISSGQIEDIEKTRKARQYIGFYAPQSGVLSRLNVREGMYIDPATEVMSLANLERIWLIAEVFEREADWVEIGQTAEAEISALPGRTWEGEVDYIYPDLDPVTRTLRVRLGFENPDYALMPNMYARVRIQGDPGENVLSIPREALIRGADNERVILALGDGRFRAREVVAGIESGDRIEIRKGLQEGERIVTSAQFLLDSEASLKASLQRMEAPDDMNGMEGVEAGGEHEHD
ncbi:MAG: efflux RND transporter periplasmic adaptor subunit [Gammaproteobacteria bacterium]